MVKFKNREIWADLENRSKVVHSENFPIWRPASGDRDHVTHHVTSHVTHWGQWKYASRSWHAVGNHRRQLKLMYRSKISGRGPKHCSGSKFQCRPRPVYSTEGKPAGPTPVVPVRVRGPALILKTEFEYKINIVSIPSSSPWYSR